LEDGEELLEEFVKGPSNTAQSKTVEHVGGTIAKGTTIEDVYEIIKKVERIE